MGWKFVLLLNLGERRVFVVLFSYNLFAMPAEEPSGVTKQADGNVGLDFSKEDRTGVTGLGVIRTEVTEMIGSVDLVREGKMIEVFNFGYQLAENEHCDKF